MDPPFISNQLGNLPSSQLPAVEYAVGAIIAGYLGWKAGEWINKDDQTNDHEENQEQTLEDKTKKRPPYCGEKIGNDPTKPHQNYFSICSTVTVEANLAHKNTCEPVNYFTIYSKSLRWM